MSEKMKTKIKDSIDFFSLIKITELNFSNHVNSCVGLFPEMFVNVLSVRRQSNYKPTSKSNVQILVDHFAEKIFNENRLKTTRKR